MDKRKPAPLWTRLAVSLLPLLVALCLHAMGYEAEGWRAVSLHAFSVGMLALAIGNLLRS